jgi:hypothetical protein
MTRFISALAVALTLTPPATAQSRPVLGTWSIEWELGRRVENEDVQIIKATGTLTLKTVGDSVLATVTVASRSDGMPAPKPYTMSGKLTTDGAALSQVQQMRMNVNGEETVHEARVTWRVTATGDALSGEIEREMPGMMAAGGPPTRITGTRVKP